MSGLGSGGRSGADRRWDTGRSSGSARRVLATSRCFRPGGFVSRRLTRTAAGYGAMLTADAPRRPPQRWLQGVGALRYHRNSKKKGRLVPKVKVTDFKVVTELITTLHTRMQTPGLPEHDARYYCEALRVAIHASYAVAQRLFKMHKKQTTNRCLPPLNGINHSVF